MPDGLDFSWRPANGTTTLVGTEKTDALLIFTEGMPFDVDIAAGQGTVGGHTVTFSGMEIYEFYGTHAGSPDSVGNGTVLGSSGAETITTIGSGMTVHGGDGNDILRHFGNGRSTLHGGAGDDELHLLHGQLSVTGGAGTDTLFVQQQYYIEPLGTSLRNTSSDGSVLVANDVEYLDYDGDRLDLRDRFETYQTGTENGDWLVWDGSVSVDGGLGFDLLSFATEEGPVRIDFPARRAMVGDRTVRFTSIEAAEGTVLNDVFTAGPAGSRMIGHDGDDTFFAGAGADTIEGGTGNDTVEYHTSVSVSLEQGLGFTGEARGDLLSGIEAISTGVGRDTVWGSAGNDFIATGHGADQIFASAGNDRILGATETDIIIFAADLASYELSPGSSSYVTVTYIGSDQALAGETLTSVGLLAFSDQTIEAQTLAPQLQGTEGDDWLIWSGDPYANGRGGTDMLSFVNWDRGIYVGMYGGEVWVGGVNLARFASIEGVTGTVFADRFSGTEEADLFRGLGGRDTFYGSDGADRLDGGSSMDTVFYRGGSTSVSLLRGQGWTGEAAGDTLIDIETVRTGGGDDTVWGGRGDDFIFTTLGDDTLIGNAGDDLPDGSFGQDVAIFGYDRSAYRVTEDSIGWSVTVEYIGDGPGDGTDTLLGIEVLRFADGDVLL